jgi:transposase-like protein
MENTNIYKRYRLRSEIIQYAVSLYYRFNLSHRDIEDLLAERGINVTYESIRLWCNRFFAGRKWLKAAQLVATNGLIVHGPMADNPGK